MDSCLTVNNLATKSQFWRILKIIAAACCMLYSVTADGQIRSVQSSLQQNSTTEQPPNTAIHKTHTKHCKTDRKIVASPSAFWCLAQCHATLEEAQHVDCAVSESSSDPVCWCADPPMAHTHVHNSPQRQLCSHSGCIPTGSALHQCLWCLHHSIKRHEAPVFIRLCSTEHNLLLQTYPSDSWHQHSHGNCWLNQPLSLLSCLSVFWKWRTVAVCWVQPGC